MEFEIDNQTLTDLNIFPNRSNDISVYDFFKQTKTGGGQNELIKMMKNPSCEYKLLHERVEAIKFIQNNNVPFVFTDKMLDFIEHYLNLGEPPLRTNRFYVLVDKIDNLFRSSNEYYVIEKGLRYLIFFIAKVRNYLEYLEKFTPPYFFQSIKNEANKIIDYDIVQELISSPIRNEEEKIGKQSFLGKIKYQIVLFRWEFSINYFDNKIRNQKRLEILNFIKKIYQLDTLITVANSGKKNNFCLPFFFTDDSSLINIENIFHPFVNKPVANTITINQGSNMCFLTGANMAGKSTFLKSVGLCCYLSHIGFPVPAEKMETGIFSGLITSINLSDNVSIGYSHFYSEVKRVKNTALKIQEKGKVLVVFDELFRGTNVKDAYDASLMIISALADIQNCAFFISTHIIEVADELKSKQNIIFKYFESDVIGENPKYTFKLKDGVSKERHGLRIVKNEKILEILKQIIEKENIKV